MGLRDLSEAIILQSAADLLSEPHEGEALEFFSGEGFRLCAEMAKMGHDDKLTFLEMLAGCISSCRKTKDRPAAIPDTKKTVRRWADHHRAKKSSVVARAF
ncbi:MAG TPA: hypothetical protein VN328_01100 [Thermodesulfovibrionales bacterium]|nr:hypothetical protein [Thermodesulfovibrionales bacterium]